MRSLSWVRQITWRILSAADSLARRQRGLGDFNFSAGGTLGIGIHGATHFGAIHVTGKANVAGTLTIHNPGPRAAPGHRL